MLAHELLHTLRATDKYSFASNTPLLPDGYAAPDAKPLLPQTEAELMAGRIALDEQHAEMPAISARSSSACHGARDRLAAPAASRGTIAFFARRARASDEPWVIA